MKNIIFTLFTLTIFVVMIGSCNSNKNKTADVETSLKDTVITGQELFRENCAGCHGVNREGTPPKFPSLLHVKDTLSKEKVYTQIKKGRVLMHGFSYLPENEINTIIAFLFDEPNQQTTVKISSLSELGENLVKSNCLSCHHLTVKDSLPKNVKAFCPLVDPSALVGEKIKVSKEEFYLILKTGPCYMPSFDFLNEKDKLAIWTYLNSLREKSK